MGKKRIETLVRGVVVQDGMLLLCHTKGADNTYLPGGHVEFRERAEVALVREIEEEMGVSSRCGRFLGAVEHSFVQKEKIHCEVNLLFALEVDALCVNERPPSEEDYIEFMWQPLSELSSSRLEPAALRELLPEWLGNGPGWATSGDVWAE